MYIDREDWRACVLTGLSSLRTNCLMFLYIQSYLLSQSFCCGWMLRSCKEAYIGGFISLYKREN